MTKLCWVALALLCMVAATEGLTFVQEVDSFEFGSGNSIQFFVESFYYAGTFGGYNTEPIGTGTPPIGGATGSRDCQYVVDVSVYGGSLFITMFESTGTYDIALGDVSAWVAMDYDGDDDGLDVVPSNPAGPVSPDNDPTLDGLGNTSFFTDFNAVGVTYILNSDHALDFDVILYETNNPVPSVGTFFFAEPGPTSAVVTLEYATDFAPLINFSTIGALRLLLTTSVAVDANISEFFTFTNEISGHVYEDCNENFTDNGEFDVVGATLLLRECGTTATLQSTTTDINGDYAFGVDSSITCYDVCLDTTSAPFFGNTVVFEPGVVPNTVFCYEDITVFDSLDNDFGVTSTEIICADDSLDCTEDAGTAPSDVGDAAAPLVSTLGLCNPSFQFSDNAVGDSCSLSIDRFFTTTDANSATCSQNIVVSDTTPPTVASSPPNQLIDCNDDTSEAANGFPTYNDDCNTPNRMLQPDVVNPGCGNTVVITRTWFVVDNCDNAGPTVQQTITTQDTTNPTVTAPADFSGPCDGMPTGAATGTDDCGTVIFTPGSSFTDINVVTDPCGTTFTRRWTGADECGNVGTADQLISLTDQDPPTITPPPATTIDCTASSAESNTGSPSDVADTCGGLVTVSSSDGAVTGGPCTQTFVRTWTASDQCGTTSDTTVSQTITIDDSIAPSLSVPNTAVVQCNLASTAPSSTGFATAVDDCQGNLTPTFTDSSAGDSCFTTISRTWTVDDGCGQVSTGTQIVNVQDTTPPTFTVPADNFSLQCSDPTDPGANGNPTGVSDACSATLAPAFVDTTTGSGCVTTITRRWTVTDACGQTSPTQTQTLVFTDTQAPSVTAPVDATVQCGGATDPSVTGTASTVDDCNTNPSLNFGDSAISGNGCIDTFTRTWTSSDSCNTGSSVQTITIQDTTAPSITVSASETVELCPCLAVTGFTDAGPTACGSDALGSDACQGAVATTFSDNTVLATCGQVLREWTASDGCGNSAGPVTQTLNFVDTSGPIFQVASVVSPLALQCGDDTSVVNTGIAAFTDCTSVTVSFQDATTINDGCNFSVDRTFTATNDCGTTSSFTQTITADDTLAPSFDTFPATETLECGTSTGAFAIGSAPTVSDICQGSLTLTYSDSVSTLDPCTDQINRSWITDDGCGNFNTQVQIIFVQDTTVPIFNAFPADVSTECNGGGPGAYPPATFGSATGTDACSPLGTFAASFTDPPVISGSCPGTFSRTWQVTDTCGLSVSSVQSFTINDTTPPVFSSFPADATVECDTSSAPSVTGTPGVTEACTFSPATFTDGILVGSCPITFQRTWTATDTCQSINSVQVITIDDTSAPFFSFFPNDLPSLECGDSTSPSVTGSPTADDSCSFSSASTPTFSDAVVTTGDDCIVTITRTWSTTNTCGITFTSDQTLTYTDTQPPAVVSVPGNSIQECTSPIPAPNGVPGTDACSGALGSVTTSESTSGSCPQIFTRLYTFADTCGNVDIRSQVITITDTTPPTITDVNDVTVDCNDPRTPGNTGFPTAGDSCDPGTPSITFQDVETTAQCPNDLVTRTFTATDWCGNQATSQQDITVTNNLPPVVTAPNDVVVECGESTNSVDLGTATAVHPCNLGFVITFTDAVTAGGDSCLEFTTRTWSATDICGNVGTDDQLIEVSDNIEPDFTCFPDDVTVHCSDSTDPSNTGGFPCATDECQGVVCQITFFDSAPVQLPAIGDCPADLVYTRTWLADDACGLQVSQNQIITVIFHEQAEDCPAEPCPAVPCQLCECPVEPPCNCCAMGGITACNPVPCNPVECTAVPCTAVDCLPCPVSSGTTASPSQPCGPEVPCIPQIRFVHVNDDDDNRAVTDGNYVQEQPAQRDGEDDGDDDNDDDNGASQLAGAVMAMLLPIVVFLLFN